MNEQIKNEDDPAQVWKVYFSGGRGTKESPYTVNSGVNIKDVLRDAAMLTTSMPDHSVYFTFNKRILTLDNTLRLEDVGKGESAVLSTAKASLKELIDEEQLDKAVRPLTETEMRAFQQELQHKGPLDKMIQKGTDFFKQLTSRAPSIKK